MRFSGSVLKQGTHTQMRELGSTHFGNIRHQASQAEQGLRHSLHTGACLTVCVLVCSKSTDHTNPEGRRQGEKGLWGAQEHRAASPSCPPT